MSLWRISMLALAIELGGCAAVGSPVPAAVSMAYTTDATGPADEQLYLELNVPAYRLDVYLSGLLLRSDTVAVGMPRYPTPIRDYRITSVVWNPWWYPPPSDWASKERPRPPGPSNPMGRVKLRAATYIYLHGTPDEASLGHAASHACIRMSNADALSLARLVHRYASPEITEVELDALEADPDRTRTIPLGTPVPFSVVYRVAEIRDGVLQLHPDVYRRVGAPEAETIRVLEAHGIARDRLDRTRLEAALRQSRLDHVSVPLDSLLQVRPDISGAAMRSPRREAGERIR